MGLSGARFLMYCLWSTKWELGSTRTQRVLCYGFYFFTYFLDVICFFVPKTASKMLLPFVNKVVYLVYKEACALDLVFVNEHPGWGRAQNRLWSDRPRQVGPLIRLSQTEVTSDQTRMRSKIIVRSKCARSRLWSGEFQTEVTPDQPSSRPLSRRVPDHCPD